MQDKTVPEFKHFLRFAVLCKYYSWNSLFIMTLSLNPVICMSSPVYFVGGIAIIAISKFVKITL